MAEHYLRTKKNPFQHYASALLPSGWVSDIWGKVAHNPDDLDVGELLRDIGSDEAIEAAAYWESLPASIQESNLENYWKKPFSATGKWTDYSKVWGLGGNTQELDVDSLINDLLEVSENFSLDGLEEPSYESITADILSGKDASVQNYLNILAEDEARKTQFFQDQLEENRLGFDQYRQQLLSNQYQQNAQLLGSVESAMDKSRRNALEAGASAGLRMAENINTTLALQNKQSQISLETSNQLAQQLLNQRQANAGIRSEYNQMLSDNAAERRSYLDNKVEETYTRKTADYDRAVKQRNTDIANSTNPYASSYSNWYDDRNKNKSQSQYN